MTSPIDLRSDTVTQPTAAMRQIMASAEVGDDVFGEDPTVRRLQERSAELLGTEDAVYVPSGTMANQIAIMLHCRPGDDVVVGEFGHSYSYEGGAGAAFGGVQFTIAAPGGLFTAADVESKIHPDDSHFSRTRLILAENSHNRSGGRIFPLDSLRDIRALANNCNLALHIDGARLLNAAVAADVNPTVYGGIADTLSLCFSKGLGAPVGSVIAGSFDAMKMAHRYRKMLGGGMRQAGIIAAAALYSLDHHVERLADDHRRARRFAEQLAEIDGVSVDLERVQTNIVLFDVEQHPLSAPEIQKRAGQLGLRFLALGPDEIRAVFHLDVDDEEMERAADVVRQVLKTGQNR